MKTEIKENVAYPVPEAPDRIAIPTLPPYDKAMLENGGNASVRMLKNPEDAEKLHTENGRLFYENEDITEKDIEDMLLPAGDGEENADIRLLDLLYTASLYDLWYRNRDKKEGMLIEAKSPAFTEHPVAARFAQLLMAAGYDRSQSSQNRSGILKRLEKQKNLIGVLKDGKRTNMQVITNTGIDGIPLTIAFCSPYMNEIIARVLCANENEIKRSAPGSLPPGHCYDILPRAIKRNASAYCVMRATVNAVAQSGKSPAAVRLRDILADDPDLTRAMERATTTQYHRVTMQRGFSQGWQMLWNDTDLAEAYEDIRLPDPKNGTVLPTNKTIDKMTVNITYAAKRPEKTVDTSVMTILKGWYEVPMEPKT